jgi:hypothetical protein
VSRRSWPRRAGERRSYQRSTLVAASRPSPSERWCSATRPMTRPPLHTAAPDMPPQGDSAGSGSRSGAGTETSSVPSRRLASTAIVPTAWAESRYRDGAPPPGATGSSRSLNSGKPIALQARTASRSATRPNATVSTRPMSPGRGSMATTATSTPGSDQATRPAATHSPDRSASKRTWTPAWSRTTWAAVSTASAVMRYPDPRRSGPAALVVTMTSATRSGSIPAASPPEPPIGATAPRARRRSRPRPSPRRPGAAAGRA